MGTNLPVQSHPSAAFDDWKREKRTIKAMIAITLILLLDDDEKPGDQHFSRHHKVRMNGDNNILCVTKMRTRRRNQQQVQTLFKFRVSTFIIWNDKEQSSCLTHTHTHTRHENPKWERRNELHVQLVGESKAQLTDGTMGGCVLPSSKMANARGPWSQSEIGRALPSLWLSF